MASKVVYWEERKQTWARKPQVLQAQGQSDEEVDDIPVHKRHVSPLLVQLMPSVPSEPYRQGDKP